MATRSPHAPQPSRRRDRLRSSRRALATFGPENALEARLLLAADVTKTVLAVSSSSAPMGATLTLNVTVTDVTNSSGVPTQGTVTFTDGPTTLGTAILDNGTASFSTSALAVGQHQIAASYGGTSSYAASLTSPTPTSTIETIAGTGTAGSTGNGGPATAAEFDDPEGMVKDAAGNLYIADGNNHVVRKVTPAGVISIFAGTGTSGNTGDGGQATSAELNTPEGLAVDDLGDLFIADQDGEVIREVTTDGIIHTIAGTGTAGDTGDGGLATAAKLSFPSNMVFDAAGDLYIADLGNESVREVKTNGIISTFAGTGAAGYTGDNGLATAATLNTPYGLAIDPAGDIYISDVQNFAIREVTTDGIIHTVAGTGTGGYTGDNGPATAATLTYPAGIALDSSGDLYIADQGNNVVREVTPDGTIRTLAGTGTAGYTGDGGAANAATFNDDQQIATDSANNVYIADRSNNAIREVLASVPITVTAYGAATQFVVSAASTGPTAGTADAVTVTAEDAYGNVVANYAGTVHFASSDAQATLPANATLTNGKGVFQVAFGTAGSQSVTATDGTTASINGTQSGIVVTPAAATRYTVTGGAAETAGGVESVTVTAYDAYGNVATGYAGTVAVTSSDSQATLPPNAALTNGVGTFEVTLKTAGSDSITATDSTTSNITGTAAGIPVTPAVATHFALTSGVTETAGGIESVTVTAYDAYGNVATGYAGTVHITSSDPKAALPADATLTDGTGTFDVTLKTAGSQAIMATDATTGSITGTEPEIMVTAAAATHFTVSGGKDETAGGVETMTITAEDTYGNVATGYAGTVHITSSDPKAALPADATLNNGTGPFDVTLVTAGSQSITATDTATASIIGTEAGIVVTAAVATHFTVSGPTSVVLGTPTSVTVTAYDAYGNVATADTDSVQLTSSDAKATLPAAAALTAGVGTESVTFGTTGTQSLTATDTTSADVTGTDASITVTQTVSKLTITGPTGPVVAGAAASFTVTALDMYGNVVTGDDGMLTLTSTDAQAQLPSGVTFASGVATFPASFETAGTMALAATAADNSALAATDSSIVVTPAAATRFVLAGLVNSVAGTAGTLTVTAYDAYGNVATNYAGTVAFTSTDPAAALPASTTLTNGVGSFAVTLNTGGTQAVTATDSASGATGSATGIVVTAMIQGTIFLDTNASGTLDSTESGMAGRVVFLDLKGTGAFVAGDPLTTTNAQGHFSFPGYAAGSATVLENFSQDATDRLVASQTTTNADESLTIADVPLSPTYPLPVGFGPVAATSSGTAAASYVQSLYRDVLGRTGSDAEVAGWVANMAAGMTDAEVATMFVDSLEHRTDEVAAFYSEFLGRGVDVGASTWVDALMAGATEQEVAEAILGSAEFQADHAGTDATIQALYNDVLGREGSDAEVATFRSALSSGASMTQVIATFVGSDEANDRIVASLYTADLHRPEDSGSSIWQSMLRANASASAVAIGILSSPEYEQDAQGTATTTS